MADALTLPDLERDQPPEVDEYAEPGGPGALPPAGAAGSRVADFVRWFGDGRILPKVAAEYDAAEQPPLFARDLEALARLTEDDQAVQALARVWEIRNEHAANRDTCLAWAKDPDKHVDEGHPERLRALADQLHRTVTRLDGALTRQHPAADRPAVEWAVRLPNGTVVCRGPQEPAETLAAQHRAEGTAAQVISRVVGPWHVQSRETAHHFVPAGGVR